MQPMVLDMSIDCWSLCQCVIIAVHGKALQLSPQENEQLTEHSRVIFTVGGTHVATAFL